MIRNENNINLLRKFCDTFNDILSNKTDQNLKETVIEYIQEIKDADLDDYEKIAKKHIESYRDMRKDVDKINKVLGSKIQNMVDKINEQLPDGKKISKIEYI